MPIEKPTGTERAVFCNDCGWSGRMGQLIAADILRCPKCRSKEFRLLVSETPTVVQ